MENLQEAERIIRASDHLIYMSYPLIRDKKLLLKILLEIKKAVAFCINSILQYEYTYKRINLYKDPRENMRIFETKSAKRYSITFQEIQKIKELFSLAENHKKSPFEFMKKDKVIIMTENMSPLMLDLPKVKEFLNLGKSIFQKIRNNFLNK